MHFCLADCAGLYKRRKKVGRNMNRSEGLVKRRTRAGEGGDGDVVSGKEAEDQNGSDGELEDLDSKEKRLTLMEEVLLLGLKDKEVCLLEISC